jgi:hypothetical protein
MQPPAGLLEDADLLAYAVVPSLARFTGRLSLHSNDKRVGPVAHLAILKPRNEPGLYLAHCDESWHIVGLQAWNGPAADRITTVEEMKRQAERYHGGLMPSRQEVSKRDG